MKRIMGIAVLLVVVFVSAWMVSMSYKKIQAKNRIGKALKVVPEFTYLNPDSLIISTHQFSPDRPLIIIYFNSECGHCKEEAELVVENHESLDGIKVLFVSLEPLSKIKEFDKHFGLTELPGIHLGKIDEATAFDILGVTTSPQIYIYGRAGHLEKQFRGTTKAETLVKYANR